jgi:exodeoxyribonuclease V alpha subunit
MPSASNTGPARPGPAAPARTTPSATTAQSVTTNTTKPAAKPKSGGFSKSKAVEQEDDLFSAGDQETVREAASEPVEAPEDSGVERVVGTIQRVIYSTPDGYAVYSVRTKDQSGHRNDLTVSVSSNVLFHRNDKIIALGTMGVYRGRETFKATVMTQEIAKGAKGVVAWLKTKVVQGVGVSTAEKIAKYFGDEIELVIGDPDELVKSGIPRDKAEKIADAWNSNASQPELMSFLGKFPIGQMTIAKIIKQYGAAARRIVEENPWRLFENIAGISFEKADEIAVMVGIDLKKPERIRAGLKAAIDRKTGSEGHCGLPRDILIMEAMDVLKIDRELIDDQIDEIIGTGTLVQPKGSELIYPIALYIAEKNLVNRIENLMEQGDYIDEADARSAIEEVIKELGVKRDESQVNAAIMAICNPVSIITGGPGTGKSTTQKIIVAALRRLNRTLMAAAPTGRAAKRLTEVSGMDASTCHRLLSYDARAGGFVHTASNPFKIDRLIVDEFSMVDIKIASAFFEAIKPTAGITIVGDVDQLASVGHGQVLRDMIESGRIPTTRLQTVHRQSGDSGIVIAASQINRGEYPTIDGRNIDGFELIDNFNGSYQDRNSEAAIRKTIVDLMAERLPAMGFNPLDDVQVLTPMRITDLGINVLNEDLKNRMNPMTEENGVNLGTYDYSVGDRVMHVRNDYEKSVFNGEVGFVDYIGEKINENGSKEAFIRVDYSGHPVFYKRSDIADIIPAWAATVHKSQGCEFPVAIVVCSNAHKRMLTRNLIYTAVTRAKKLCIVVGNRAALEHAVATVDTSRRFTGLKNMLENGLGLDATLIEDEAPDVVAAMSYG